MSSRTLGGLVAGAALVLATLISTSAAQAGCGARLQTGPGQNPIALAQRCGTTYQDLKRANPLIDMKHGLRGQVITVPQKPKPLIDPKINNGLPPAGSTRPPHGHVPIRPSSMIESRPTGHSAVAVAGADASATVRVRRGDTLGAIARRHGVSLGALMRANPGVDPRRLAIGQTLVLPVAD